MIHTSLRSARTMACVLATFGVLILANAARAHVPARGTDAPAIALDDLSGTRVETAKLSPRVQVLVFGEIGQDTTSAACADVLATLADPRLAGESIVPILITAQSAPSTQLREEAAKGRFPAVILRDPQRDAFGAYKVLVLPTTVIVDGKGKVVHAMPGHFARYKETLGGAVQVATGKQTIEQFEKSLEGSPAAPNADAQRADRLVHLGRELMKHNLDEMAQARFGEALALMPNNSDAKLGLASLALKREALPEAESLFRSVLSAAPDSAEATLGLGTVHLKRGGEDLPKAEALARSILDKNPKEARARYLMGQVYERKGDLAQAAAEYRKALDILFAQPMSPKEMP